jgi:hypothetical protein
MDKITKLTAKVVQKLIQSGIDFESVDDCPDDYHYLNVATRTVIIGDDHERESWVVMLEKFTKDGKSVSFPELTEILSPIFGGAPTHPIGFLPPDYTKSEPDLKVNNWVVGKKVRIVQGDDFLEIYQDYVKR